MPEFDYGPADVFIIRHREGLPAEPLLDALAELIESDTVRLLDLLTVSRGIDEAVEVFELDRFIADRSGSLIVEAAGLTGQDDIADVADSLSPGSAATIAVIEQVWARTLARRFADSGSELMATMRITAPELNAVAAAAHVREGR